MDTDKNDQDMKANFTVDHGGIIDSYNFLSKGRCEFI